MSENVDNFFDIEPDEEAEASKEIVVPPIIHHPNIKENTLDDYHSTRESMKTMIYKGTEMIDNLIKVTTESENPRAYEVLAGYMKTITEMNKALMDIHKNTKEITELKEETPPTETTNYVYVGSTESLQQELDNNK